MGTPQIEEPKSEFTCPACGRPLYDRRHLNCGYCGKAIPPEMLLTQAQADEIDKELAADQKRQQEVVKRIDALGPHIYGKYRI